MKCQQSHFDLTILFKAVRELEIEVLNLLFVYRRFGHFNTVQNTLGLPTLELYCAAFGCGIIVTLSIE